MRVHPLVVQTIVIMLCCIWLIIVGFGTLNTHIENSNNNNTVDLIKIECRLHRDIADVHRLCVEHGYDR